MFQEHFDRVVAFVSEPRFAEELTASKKAYFELTGEVFETDDVFDMRMASFLEWFIFDRVLNGKTITPVELFIEEKQAELTDEERIAFRNFSHTVHSVFEVGKLKTDFMHMKDVFTGKSHAVFERRKPVGIDSGDVLEARLITTPDNKLMFSPAFVFHPRNAKKAIMKMVKQHKKAGLDPKDLVFKLSYLRLKVDRYKHLAPERLYIDAANT